jgi:hypothetical protein
MPMYRGLSVANQTAKPAQGTGQTRGPTTLVNLGNEPRAA